MNEVEFRKEMLDHHDTQEKLAEAMGIGQSGVSLRIKGKIDFRQSEINFIIHRYGLSPDRVRELFFDQEASLKDT